MTTSDGWLTTEDELRSMIPPPAARTTLKIQPQLEETGRTWIRNAGLVGLATRRPDGLVDVVARAQPENLAHAPDDYRVLVSNARDARIGDVETNLGAHPQAGLIAILPGLDSTIRANGTAQATEGAIAITITETYMHCPKAFVRSKLWRAPAASGATPGTTEWQTESGAGLGAAARRFIEASPFLLLGTSNTEGEADVSPRGDPPGFVHVIEDDTLLIPDRPGNHIVDSFRNILSHPTAGLLFLIPGEEWTMRVSGEARLTADESKLAPLAVQGKAPKVGIELRVRDSTLEPAPALGALWAAAARPPKMPSLGRTLIDQVQKKGRFRAIKGKMLDLALDRDVKTNLY